MSAALQGKRDQIVSDIDKCLSLAESDPTRALQAIDEARKAMQALWYRIWERHHVSGGRNRRAIES